MAGFDASGALPAPVEAACVRYNRRSGSAVCRSGASGVAFGLGRRRAGPRASKTGQSVENRKPASVVVAIVNYRSAPLTLRALASLRGEVAHPALSVRAVVVENASGDEELLGREIPARFGDFAELIVSERNGGFGAGNNVAFRRAFEGAEPPDYLLCLNPDTEVRPGGVLELVRFMEQHPQVGIAGSRFEEESGRDWPIAFRFPGVLAEVEQGCTTGLVTRLLSAHKVPREMGPEPAQVDWLPGASMMIRREVLERIGGFDEGYFLYYEETDLCRRARASNFETWHVPQSRVMHIRGQSTGVTVLNEKPKRLPAYWYESRRRYYLKNHGPLYAALVDLAALGAGCMGFAKRALKGEPHTPHMLRDLLAHSALWPKNRGNLAPERCYVPRVGAGA
jgi:GT2 family glycosyltransferase